MNIVITVGHPYSGYRLVHATLVSAGLAQAEHSGTKSISAEDLHSNICESQNLDPSGLTVGKPVSPGNAWKEKAADLIAANSARENWGWADAGTTWLLDSWKRLDPSSRFVLVYSPPELAVAQALQGKVATPDNVNQAVVSWTAWNTEISRFYNRNQDRCLLINALAVIHAPAMFTEKVSATFGLSMGQLTTDHQVDRSSVSSIASALALSLIEDRDEAIALYQELESSADLDSAAVFAAAAERSHAWGEYSNLLAELGNAAREAREQTECANRLQQECETATLALAEAQEKIDEQAASLRKAESSVNVCESEISELRPRNAELAQENELLLLQLHQVQEELEDCFLNSKELENRRESEAKQSRLLTSFIRDQLAKVVIDMQGNIDGNNWYYVEPDGRWAGPNETSSIRLPALGRGNYEVLLDVVNTMAPEILDGMTLSLNGTPLDIGRDSESFPTIVRACFPTDGIAPRSDSVWEFGFSFPKLVAPAELGLEDPRKLAICLRSITLSAIDRVAKFAEAPSLKRAKRQIDEQAAKLLEANVAVATQRAAEQSEFQRRFMRDQLTEAVIDMRRDIEGENWYYVEPDGRWAGPDEVSSIRLPALGARRYEVTLDVSNAMAREILCGMKLYLNGMQLEISEDWDTYPALVRGCFDAAEITECAVWEFRFLFPKLASPAEHGMGDQRMLAICLSSIKLRALDQAGNLPATTA